MLPYREAKKELPKGATESERRAFEIRYVRAVLGLAGGNVSKAAAAARVSRQTLYVLMRKHGISPDGGEAPPETPHTPNYTDAPRTIVLATEAQAALALSAGLDTGEKTYPPLKCQIPEGCEIPILFVPLVHEIGGRCRYLGHGTARVTFRDPDPLDETYNAGGAR